MLEVDQLFGLDWLHPPWEPRAPFARIRAMPPPRQRASSVAATSLVSKPDATWSHCGSSSRNRASPCIRELGSHALRQLGSLPSVVRARGRTSGAARGPSITCWATFIVYNKQASTLPDPSPPVLPINIRLRSPRLVPIPSRSALTLRYLRFLLFKCLFAAGSSLSRILVVTVDFSWNRS